MASPATTLAPPSSPPPPSTPTNSELERETSVPPLAPSLHAFSCTVECALPACDPPDDCSMLVAALSALADSPLTEALCLRHEVATPLLSSDPHDFLPHGLTFTPPNRTVLWSDPRGCKATEDALPTPVFGHSTSLPVVVSPHFEASAIPFLSDFACCAAQDATRRDTLAPT
ncbi:unnamed protein product, partial [Hydatigera taeniaeformis]|uniref:Uncharacterized protein n=1 Tax=Hydatigena taeniaeformis TaxID=6205 RepID=A0A0R3WTS5_HYDTA